MSIAICNYLRVTDTTAPSARSLAIGERHLAMLAELGDIAMAVSRAYGASAIAAAEATDMILKDDYFVPEVGRARACGGKDSAESFQKVTRALRLTLMMEKQTVEWMEGRRSAFVARPSILGRDCPADAGDRDRATDADALRCDIERGSRDVLDPPDPSSHAAFRQAVDTLSADLGAEAHWAAWTIMPPPLASGREQCWTMSVDQSP